MVWALTGEIITCHGNHGDEGINQANDQPRNDAKASATDPNLGPEKDIVEAVAAAPNPAKKDVVAAAVYDTAGEAKVDIATVVITIPDEAKKDVVVAAVRDPSASGFTITSEEVTRGV
jgi:hypothetical protein